MTGLTFFVKPCPACGRNSQIALAYLGQEVRCRHCSRVFTANDSQAKSESLNDPISFWINFTEFDDASGFDGSREWNRHPR